MAADDAAPSSEARNSSLSLDLPTPAGAEQREQVRWRPLDNDSLPRTGQLSALGLAPDDRRLERRGSPLRLEPRAVGKRSRSPPCP